MNTVDLDKAREMIGSGQWHFYELDTRERRFRRLDNFTVDDLEDSNAGSLFLSDRLSYDGWMPYSDMYLMTGIDGGYEDGGELDGLFGGDDEPPSYECLACGAKFANANELVRHQFDAGHDNFDEPVATDRLGDSICECIAALRSVAKASLNAEYDEDCLKMAADILENAKALQQRINKCAHK